MTNYHLTDSAIQEYALDKLGCDKMISDHIMTCDDCRTRVLSYQSLLAVLETEPPPAFDFDLAAAVIAQLPVAASSRTSSESRFIYWTIGFSLIMLLIPVFLFRTYLANLFSGALPMFLYLSITIAFIFLTFQGVEMFRKYRQKMLELNIY